LARRTGRIRAGRGPPLRSQRDLLAGANRDALSGSPRPPEPRAVLSDLAPAAATTQSSSGLRTR
jgi:hypothetical protein